MAIVRWKRVTGAASMTPGVQMMQMLSAVLNTIGYTSRVVVEMESPTAGDFYYLEIEVTA